jgi:hypothetical protein
MILKAFSVYDSKAEAYLPPFFTTTAALAMRSFETAANSGEHDFSKYAADYTLFEIGHYDDATAQLVALEAFSNLGTALTFIRQHSTEYPVADLADQDINRGLQLARTEKGPR